MREIKPILQMNKICKTFPGVRALFNVDLTLYPGEIHALMGENGAGKSTLIKVLTGNESIDSGEVYLNGEKIKAKSTKEAQSLGISTVYQEVNLCPNLSVAENIFIGREIIKNGVIDWKEINKKAKITLEKINIKIDVTRTLDSYSVAVQQMVAIARAIDISAKVLILDEPTSSLDNDEVEELFNTMNKLKSQGMAIVFVTHFMDQVYRVSDRITVLRNGELVGSYPVSDLPKVQLVGKMIGKEFDELADIHGNKQVELKKDEINVFLEAIGISNKGVIEKFDFNVDKGEVVGLAGLLGSGRTEIVRLLYGVDRNDTGNINIKGRTVNMKNPITAIKNGLSFCSENRKTEGIVDSLTVRENIILALQAKKGIMNTISRKQQEEIADKYIKLLNIKTSGSEQLIKNLSGGNQQKVLLARWLITEPELLILDEPTRGIDVGAKAEIQKLIVELAAKGMSVIFISSELEEMVRCCDRVNVLRDREIIGQLIGIDINEHNIMKTIAGGQE